MCDNRTLWWSILLPAWRSHLLRGVFVLRAVSFHFLLLPANDAVVPLAWRTRGYVFLPGYMKCESTKLLKVKLFLYKNWLLKNVNNETEIFLLNLSPAVPSFSSNDHFIIQLLLVNSSYPKEISQYRVSSYFQTFARFHNS